MPASKRKGEVMKRTLETTIEQHKATDPMYAFLYNAGLKNGLGSADDHPIVTEENVGGTKKQRGRAKKDDTLLSKLPAIGDGWTEEKTDDRVRYFNRLNLQVGTVDLSITVKNETPDHFILMLHGRDSHGISKKHPELRTDLETYFAQFVGLPPLTLH